MMMNDNDDDDVMRDSMSYHEAYLRRQDGSRKSMDCLFVERGALRAVERRMIDKSKYMDFLEAQLLRMSQLLMTAEKKAEERKKKNEETSTLQSQVSEMKAKLLQLELQDMSKGEHFFSPTNTTNQQETAADQPEELALTLQNDANSSIDDANRVASKSQHNEEEIESRTLASKVMSLEKRIDEIKQQNEEKFRIYQRLESRMDEIDDKSIQVQPLLLTQLQKKCQSLAQRIERVQSKAQEAITVTSRHAEERADLFVDAITAVEERIDRLKDLISSFHTQNNPNEERINRLEDLISSFHTQNNSNEERIKRLEDLISSFHNQNHPNSSHKEKKHQKDVTTTTDSLIMRPSMSTTDLKEEDFTAQLEGKQQDEISPTVSTENNKRDEIVQVCSPHFQKHVARIETEDKQNLRLNVIPFPQIPESHDVFRVAPIRKESNAQDQFRQALSIQDQQSSLQPPLPEGDPLLKYENDPQDKVLFAQPWIDSALQEKHSKAITQHRPRSRRTNTKDRTLIKTIRGDDDDDELLLSDKKTKLNVSNSTLKNKIVKRKKKKSTSVLSAVAKRKAELLKPIGPQWPLSVTHTGPLPRSAWIPAARVGTPRNLAAVVRQDNASS